MVIGRLLKVETALALILAWMVVFLLPRRWLTRLGALERPSASAAESDSRILSRARGVAWRVEHVAGRLPWHSTCLVRAVAGMLLLKRRGVGGWAIRFGVRKRDGVLEAHAWLLLGPTILLGEGEAGDGYIALGDISGPPHR